MAWSGAKSSSWPSNWDAVKITHAVFGILAWVVFFPFGAVMIRAIHTSNSFWVHAGIQMGTFTMILINAGTGIWMAGKTHMLSNYHPVIGLVLFSFAFVQALAGFWHHLLYKSRTRRTTVSHIHIWLGRILITVGMINGGLGLLLSDDANQAEFVSYGVIVAVIWIIWASYWMRWEVKRIQRRSRPHHEKDEFSWQDE